MFIVSLTMSIAIAFALMLTVFHATSATEDPLDVFDNANSIEELLPPHEFVHKETWGGKLPSHVQNLQHPLDLVIIAHTATSVCTTLTECSKLVKAIQNYHFRLKKSDIGYNFLIGGDGNIYEGRGWDAANSVKDKSISVSFIGNFLYDHLTENMVDALQELLIEGVELGKLKEDYKIVCHNQTIATLSPGQNVYDVVKTWKHFNPERLR